MADEREESEAARLSQLRPDAPAQPVAVIYVDGIQGAGVSGHTVKLNFYQDWPTSEAAEVDSNTIEPKQGFERKIVARVAIDFQNFVQIYANFVRIMQLLEAQGFIRRAPQGEEQDEQQHRPETPSK